MVYIYKFPKLCRLYDYQRLRVNLDYYYQTNVVQPEGPAEGSTAAANLLPVPEANWMIPNVSLPGGNAEFDMTGSQLSADFISEILTYLASTPDLKYHFGNLRDPLLACKKLPKCLTLYAAAVTCQDSQRLFDKDQTIGNNKAMAPVKGWHYLTTLASVKYFRDMTSRERWTFIQKMASIMGISGGVTSNRAAAAAGMNNPKCMFGWTLGFWLARLYNVQGVDDAHLPVALQTAKQRFLENFGMNLAQSPVALPFRQTIMKRGGVTPTSFPGAECRPPKVSRTGPTHDLPGPSAVTKEVCLNQANPEPLQMYEADGRTGSDMAVQPTEEDDEVMDTSEPDPPVLFEENKGFVSQWEEPVYFGHAGEILGVGEAPWPAATWDNEKEI